MAVSKVNETWRLEAQWTELPVDSGADGLAEPYLAAREAFREQSKWLQLPLGDGQLSAAEEDAFQSRLRALGYL